MILYTDADGIRLMERGRKFQAWGESAKQREDILISQEVIANSIITDDGDDFFRVEPLTRTVSWQDVLNCRHKKGFGDMQSYVFDVILPSGYPYFLWNDRVYKVNGIEFPIDTGLTIKDVI